MEDVRQATKLGPDGKEWAKTEAGYAHVERMMARADDKQNLMWHGWALREAFVAGAEWQEARAKPAELTLTENRAQEAEDV